MPTSAGHPATGCRCPLHEAARAYHRRWRADRRARHIHDSRTVPHTRCYCLDAGCPRNRVELAIARGLKPSRVMATTGCDYTFYRAVLDRMAAAA